jgi:hypothetical protein
LFELFGPLPDDLVFEDNLITLRAILAGTTWLVDETLLKRRMHGNNLMVTTGGVAHSRAEIVQEEERTRKIARWRVSMYDAFVADLSTAAKHGLISQDTAQKAITLCRTEQERHRLFAGYIDFNLLEKVSALIWMTRQRRSKPGLGFLLLRLPPFGLLATAKATIAPFRSAKIDPVLRGSADFGTIKPS